MKILRTILGIALILLAVTTVLPVAKAEETITLMSHDSFNISKEVIEVFEKENNVLGVQIIQTPSDAWQTILFLTKSWFRLTQYLF